MFYYRILPAAPFLRKGHLIPGIDEKSTAYYPGFFYAFSNSRLLNSHCRVTINKIILPIQCLHLEYFSQDIAKGTILSIECSCSFSNYQTDQMKSPHCFLPSANLQDFRLQDASSMELVIFVFSCLQLSISLRDHFTEYQTHSRTLFLLHPLNAPTTTFLSKNTDSTWEVVW